MNLQSYYDQISKGLHELPNKQRQILDDLKESVNDYLVDHPNAPMEEICEVFGSPEKIISDNISEVSAKELVKPKRIKIALLCIAAAVLTATVIFCIDATIDGWQSNRGHFADGPVEELTSSPDWDLIWQ